jgi:hypothetical protein
MQVNHNIVICRNYRGNVKKERDFSGEEWGQVFNFVRLGDMHNFIMARPQYPGIHYALCLFQYHKLLDIYFSIS